MVWVGLVLGREKKVDEVPGGEGKQSVKRSAGWGSFYPRRGFFFCFPDHISRGVVESSPIQRPFLANRVVA